MFLFARLTKGWGERAKRVASLRGAHRCPPTQRPCLPFLCDSRLPSPLSIPASATKGTSLLASCNDSSFSYFNFLEYIFTWKSHPGRNFFKRSINNPFKCSELIFIWKKPQPKWFLLCEKMRFLPKYHSNEVKIRLWVKCNNLLLTK